MPITLLKLLKLGIWFGVGIAGRERISRNRAEQARLEAVERQRTAFDAMSVQEVKQKILEKTGRRPRQA